MPGAFGLGIVSVRMAASTVQPQQFVIRLTVDPPFRWLAISVISVDGWHEVFEPHSCRYNIGWWCAAPLAGPAFVTPVRLVRLLPRQERPPADPPMLCAVCVYVSS